MQITLIELTERRIKFENHLCNARTAIISSTEQMLRRDCLSSTSSVKTEKIRLLAHKNIGVVNIRRANTCRFVNWDLRLCPNFITKKSWSKNGFAFVRYGPARRNCISKPHLVTAIILVRNQSMQTNWMWFPFHPLSLKVEYFQLHFPFRNGYHYSCMHFYHLSYQYR